MKPASARSPQDEIDALAAKCDGADQFKKFDALFRKVIAVPKTEIDKAEAEYKQERQDHSGPVRAPNQGHSAL